MRDCKLWLDLPRRYGGYGNCPRTMSSQILQERIKKEICGAQDVAVLSRRYSIMNQSLRLLFEHEELKGGPYCRLKILLRGEYEKRREVLHAKEN